jgi:hypothetical protein
MEVVTDQLIRAETLAAECAKENVVGIEKKLNMTHGL